MAEQMELPVDQIVYNPFQPRKEIDPDELGELVESIRSHGILQPIVVRRVGNEMQLVAGERRLRASQELGLATIPARIVDFDDQQTLEAALVENIQRSDLNPIEKALSFRDYMDRFQMNHEHLAQRLGLARSTITNLVNLLDLTPEVQNALRVNQISEGHAKILKGIKDPQKQVQFYKQIVGQGLSVKAAEALLRMQKDEPSPEKSPKSAPVEKTPHILGIENELRQRLAMKVDIKLTGKEKGQIVLRFESNDDFSRVVDWLRSNGVAA